MAYTGTTEAALDIPAQDWVGTSEDAQELDELLDVCWQTQNALIIWGPPGIGKTDRIKQWAVHKGLSYYPLDGSMIEPVDINGYPRVVDRGDHSITVMTRPDWLAEATEKDGGVLHMGEATNSPGNIHAAELEMIQGRRIGRHPLPKRLLLVLDANDVKDSADGAVLPPPMSNRLLHYRMRPNFRDWSDGMLHNFGRGPVSEREAGIRTLIVDYLTDQNNRPFWNARPADDTAAGYAWPSPRTWDKLAQTAGAGTDRTFQIQAEGWIGETAGLAFATWRSNLKLPSYEDVMNNAENVRWAPPYMQANEVFAVLTNVMRNVTPENAARTVEIFIMVQKAGIFDVVKQLNDELTERVVAFDTKRLVDKRILLPLLQQVSEDRRRAREIQENA